MTACVARVMRPGVKFDYVMILEGRQGSRKSTFVRTLAGPWFTDALGEISNKDVVDNMRGKWIIELGELAQMGKAEVNELKAFVSRDVDNVRKAYGRRSQTYPRQCVFIGTTNNDEYLKDETGGRRFWPVLTSKIDIESLEKVRDQLWAEAFANYQEGEELYLDNERVRIYAEGEQENRMIVDEISSKIEKAIEKSEGTLVDFTFDELWAAMSAESMGGAKVADYAMQSRIKKALKILGYEQKRTRLKGGGQVRKWIKIYK